MKKILLTLLTLFMASSMFADEYLYVDNVNVVKTKLGTATVKIPVKAHFDDAVSAWQLRITMPEGMTTSTWEEGEDLTIEYYNQNGKLKDLDAGVTTHDNINFVCITSATTSGYYQVDGAWVSYGPVKWLGSEEDYEEMLILTVDVAADFTGGVITVETAPSCGRDDRPDVTPCESHSLETDPYVKTAEVTVEYIAPEPVMTWNPETYTMTLSVPEGYDAHDFVLYANGSQVQLDENNSYTVEQTDEDQKIVFTAYTVHDDTETYDSNDATYGKLTEYEEVTVPAKVVEQTDKPSVTYSNETPGEIMVWAYGVNDEGVVYTLYCDGVEYTGNMPITYDIYEGYNHVWTATAQAPGKTVSDLSDPCTIKIDAQQKPLAPEATLVTDEGETQVTVNFTPATGTTVTVTVDGEAVDLPYEIERPAYGEQPKTVEFEVTVTGDNYTTNTYTETVTVQPQAAPTYAPEPELNWNETTYTMTVVVPEGYSVVVTVNGTEETITETKDYAYEQTYEEQEITFTAYTVKKTEDNNSATVEKTVKVPAKDKPLAPEATMVTDEGDENVSVTFTPAAGTAVSVKVGEEAIDLPYVIARPAYGEDPITVTFEVTVTGDNYTTNTYTVEVTVDPKAEPTYAPEPELNWDEDNYTMTVVVPEGYSVVVTGPNGTETITETTDYVIEQTGADQEITFTAYTLKNNEDNNSAVVEKKVTVPAKELKGEITIGEVDPQTGKVPVSYSGEEEGVTLSVVVKDQEGNETTLTPDEDGNIQLPAEGTYDITVTASAEGYKDLTETAEDVTWTKPQVTPTPEITVTRDAEKYTVKATGDGTVTLNIDGKTYDLRGEQSVDLLREDKDYKVTATATAKDGDKLESEATKDVIVKALVNQPEKPEVTVTPNRNPETNDVISVDIVIEAPEGTPEDAEIWYSIDGNDPVKYNGEFNYAEDGNHTIEAWVVVKDTDANVEPNSIDVEGKKEQASFEIGIGTNVNELVNGKQIAGVRYFNMAGQEMQEANGITIVVTTYTDGTTSTVKVMK